MASTKYTYSIASDTANGAVVASKLLADINGNPTITIAVDHIDIAGDVLDVWMLAALSAGEQTELDSVVASHDGESVIVDDPRTSDGRPIVVAARLGAGIDPYICGIADKVDSPTAKGGGAEFRLEFDVAGSPGDTKQLKFNFLDTVRVAAGGMLWNNCFFGDKIDMWMSAEATPLTANAGSGNCNLVPYGPGNIIVPAAGNGSHDVDLSANPLFVDAPRIVPATSGDGWWDWTNPEEGMGQVSANVGQTGGYHLFDFEVKLVHWVCGLPLMGDGERYIDPNSIDRKVRPHWTFYVEATSATGAVGTQVAWYLNLARTSTV